MSIEKFSQWFLFSAWPNPSIPSVAAGVYAIWKAAELVYRGMSGREIDSKGKTSPNRYGLITGLNSHASGRLSGDQFCVYVANRFIIWSLRAEDLPLFEGGALTLDVRTKTFIHEHLDYASALVDTSADVECEVLLTEGRAPVGEKIAHERPSLGFASLFAIACTCEQGALKKLASYCNKTNF